MATRTPGEPGAPRARWARWARWLRPVRCTLWALLAVATAVPAQPPADAGASRQAWTSAAALSRGISLGAAPDAVAAPLDASRFCRIAAHAGFRSVQLPLSLPTPPGRDDRGAADDEARLRRLDGLVDGCLAQGLSVVLDLRAPTPAVAGQRATAPAGPSNPEGWARRWQQLAARHAGRPPRLLFQLSFAPHTRASARQALLAQGLGAIRRSDRQRVVVIGWDDALGLLQLALPRDPHLIVAVRNDEPFRFTHQGVPQLLPDAAGWRGTGCCSPQEAQLLTLPLDLAQRWSQEHRYPVWLGDFKSYQAAPLAWRARHARLMRDAAEARGLPWCYGDFAGAFGAYDAAAGRWQAPLLQALVGP